MSITLEDKKNLVFLEQNNMLLYLRGYMWAVSLKSFCAPEHREMAF